MFPSLGKSCIQEEFIFTVVLTTPMIFGPKTLIPAALAVATISFSNCLPSGLVSPNPAEIIIILFTFFIAQSLTTSNTKFEGIKIAT